MPAECGWRARQREKDVFEMRNLARLSSQRGAGLWLNSAVTPLWRERRKNSVPSGVSNLHCLQTLASFGLNLAKSCHAPGLNPNQTETEKFRKCRREKTYIQCHIIAPLLPTKLIFDFYIHKSTVS